MNRLVLIDGNAVMHRAYHALPPLTSPDGTVVNIVYGFVSVILKLYADLKPTHLAVAFDRPGPTFRNELLATYQAQRPKLEDDFIRQIPLVHETVSAFGIPIFEADGFEADDMIGTICRQVAGERIKEKDKKIDQIIIVTGDRDILQLVEDEKVLVYMPTKGLSEGKLYGEKDVVERMGVAPSLIVDLKALMGDASDNYPGVAGIGPKTAIQLLNRFGSVEDIYREIDSVIGGSTKDKLIRGKESAALSKTLAAIRPDAPMIFDERIARIATLDTKEARTVLETMHFPSLLKRLTGAHAPAEKATGEKNVQLRVPKSSQQQLF